MECPERQRKALLAYIDRLRDECRELDILVDRLGVWLAMTWPNSEDASREEISPEPE